MTSTPQPYDPLRLCVYATIGSDGVLDHASRCADRAGQACTAQNGAH